ncbi:MAG: Nif3-like dinuclear metal center hexameric protein, partial [Clostridia bacterium]|nr:Nif3-like dinuclear metal center hexameric protein [Clostridia bacterium]
DNVGTLVGDRNKTVTKAIIALDCTMPVINEALKNGCELIITHHPVIFNGIKSVLDDTLVYEIIKNGLSVISMHTNLDQGDDGVNDTLCNVIGLKNVETVEAPDKFLLKKGEISPLSADDFAKHLKNVLNYPVKYVGEGEIKNVLVCSGSGAQYHTQCIVNGCDALVTAEVRHNNFLDAAQNGVALFDCGHFNTEVVVIKPLCEMLSNEFNNIQFIANTDSQIKTA